jgi:uncharacterized SAM-binding protein YcdF (DUF218 family)
MFFILSKVLNFLLSPLLWVVVLFLYGLATKRQKLKKWLFWTAFIVLIAFSNPFLGNLAIKKWEVSYRQKDVIREKYEYGIVLGGMAMWDARYNRLIFRGPTDRLMQALELYKEGKINKIIISGGSGFLINQDEKEAVFIHDYLLHIGISEKDLIIEPDSRNTHENAKNVADLLEGEKTSCILFTSSIHMRRAIRCFQKEGINALQWPTDKIAFTSDHEMNIRNLVIPSAEYLNYWTLLLKELVGFEVYRLMGYC